MSIFSPDHIFDLPTKGSARTANTSRVIAIILCAVASALCIFYFILALLYSSASGFSVGGVVSEVLKNIWIAPASAGGIATIQSQLYIVSILYSIMTIVVISLLAIHQGFLPDSITIGLVNYLG